MSSWSLDQMPYSTHYERTKEWEALENACHNLCDLASEICWRQAMLPAMVT